MNRLILSWIALALGLLCAPIWAASAFADKRVALVIGNSTYQNAPVLPKPAKDAKAIAAMFVKAGYDVVSAQYDVGNLNFKRALRQFEEAAADADIAVVYYAGHGIEIQGTNYLVPVDAKLASDRDADDEAITLDRLTESVDEAKKLRLIILDACRDNPFARNMKKQRTAALRAVHPGLGAFEPSSTNTLVAYAARAGTEAEDGDGDYSPFALALINNLFVPGLDVRLAFGRVRDEVLKKTANRQEPFVYGSLGAATVAVVAAPGQPFVAEDDLQGVKSDYSLVEKIGTRGAWQVFLTQHPTGYYSDLARLQITKLASAEPPVTTITTPQATAVPPQSPSPITREEPDACKQVVQRANAPEILIYDDKGLVWGKLRADRIGPGTVVECAPRQRFRLTVDGSTVLVDRSAVVTQQTDSGGSQLPNPTVRPAAGEARVDVSVEPNPPKGRVTRTGVGF